MASVAKLAVEVGVEPAAGEVGLGPLAGGLEAAAWMHFCQEKRSEKGLLRTPGRH